MLVGLSTKPANIAADIAADKLNRLPHEGKGPASTPYRDQGSGRFEASPARKERRAISRSNKLRSAAMQFWTTAGLAMDDTMSVETYAYIHRRISKALAPELTEEEAAEAALEDWDEDLLKRPIGLGGGILEENGASDAPPGEMTFEKYAAGLFGVADMWTDTVDELEYIIFINKLYRRVTALREARAPIAAPKRTMYDKSAPQQKHSHEASTGTFLEVYAATGDVSKAGEAAMAKDEEVAAERSTDSLNTSTVSEGAVSGGSGGGGGGGGFAAARGAMKTTLLIDPGDGGGPPVPIAARTSSMDSANPDPALTSARDRWRGALPTFRMFREIEDIVPLDKPARDKPAPSVNVIASAMKNPRRRRRTKSTDVMGSLAAAANPDAKCIVQQLVGRNTTKAEPIESEEEPEEEEQAGEGKAGDADASAAAGAGDKPQEAGASSSAAPATPDGAAGSRLRSSFRSTQGGSPLKGTRTTAFAEVVAQDTYTYSPPSKDSDAFTSPLGAPPPCLQTPSDGEADSDDEGHGGHRSRVLATPGGRSPGSGFSLKNRSAGGWIDSAGRELRTPRALLRLAARNASRGSRSRGLGSRGSRGNTPYYRRGPRTPTTPGQAGVLGGRGTLDFVAQRVASPAHSMPRPEGGAQSDGEEEVVERRSQLSRNFIFAAGAIAAGATKPGSPLRFAPLIDAAKEALAVHSDGEEDYAYAATRPSILVANKAPMPEVSPQGYSIGETGAITFTEKDDDPSDSDDGGGYDDEAERRRVTRAWRRARSRLRASGDSELLAFERRRVELEAKRLGLLKPLPRLGILSRENFLSPISNKPRTPKPRTPKPRTPKPATPAHARTPNAPETPTDRIRADLGFVPRRRWEGEPPSFERLIPGISAIRARQNQLGGAERATGQLRSYLQEQQRAARSPGLGLPKTWGKPLSAIIGASGGKPAGRASGAQTERGPGPAPVYKIGVARVGNLTGRTRVG